MKGRESRKSDTEGRKGKRKQNPISHFKEPYIQVLYIYAFAFTCQSSENYPRSFYAHETLANILTGYREMYLTTKINDINL